MVSSYKETPGCQSRRLAHTSTPPQRALAAGRREFAEVTPGSAFPRGAWERACKPIRRALFRGAIAERLCRFAFLSHVDHVDQPAAALIYDLLHLRAGDVVDFHGRETAKELPDSAEVPAPNRVDQRAQ